MTSETRRGEEEYGVRRRPAAAGGAGDPCGLLPCCGLPCKQEALRCHPELVGAAQDLTALCPSSLHLVCPVLSPQPRTAFSLAGVLGIVPFSQ